MGYFFNVSTLWLGLVAMHSSSKDQSILRAGIKIHTYHETGGLKLVLMDGHQIKLDSAGFKNSSFLTGSCTTGKYCLLVLDGHSSHLTPEFDNMQWGWYYSPVYNLIPFKHAFNQQFDPFKPHVWPWIFSLLLASLCELLFILKRRYYAGLKSRCGRASTI